jgi:hypothetical protein
VEAGAEAPDCAKIEGKKVKKERAVRFRGQGDHLALLFVDRLIENVLQVRGLTAQAGAVIHDLAVNFSSGKVDKTQDSPSTRRAKRHACGSRFAIQLKDFFIS